MGCQIISTKKILGSQVGIQCLCHHGQCTVEGNVGDKSTEPVASTCKKKKNLYLFFINLEIKKICIYVCMYVYEYIYIKQKCHTKVLVCIRKMEKKKVFCHKFQ